MVNGETTLEVTREDVTFFLQDLMQYKLLDISEETLVESQAQPSWIYRCLYFRIPLINPDRFLARTIRFVRLL